APDPAAMVVQSQTQVSFTGGSHTLSPGVYIGGISISNTSLTLLPGIYYLEGGGFQSKQSSTIVGTGVMIFNAPTKNSQGININGGTITLSAPTSGTYQGLVIFQARQSAATFNLAGGAGTHLTGTVYLARGPAVISGGSGVVQAG